MKTKILLTLSAILYCLFSYGQIGTYTLVGTGDTLLLDLENITLVRENTSDNSSSIFTKEPVERYIVQQKIDTVVLNSGNRLFLVTETQTSKRLGVHVNHTSFFKKNRSGSVYFKTDKPFKSYDINENINYVISKLEPAAVEGTDNDWKVEGTGGISAAITDTIQHTGGVIIGGATRKSNTLFEVIGDASITTTLNIGDTTKATKTLEVNGSFDFTDTGSGITKTILSDGDTLSLVLNDLGVFLGTVILDTTKTSVTYTNHRGSTAGYVTIDSTQAEFQWNGSGDTSKIVMDHSATLTTDSVSIVSQKTTVSGFIVSSIGVQSDSTAVVATVAGATIPAETFFVTQTTTSDANDILFLPATTPGRVVWIATNGTGCELRTTVSSGHTINNVDSDGTNELALAASSLFRCFAISSTAWIVVGWNNVGADLAALVPDAS